MLFEEAAAVTGSHAEACARVYELFALWSADPRIATAHARATRVLSEAAAHQAWHAQLWNERLPVAYVSVVASIAPAEAEALAAASLLEEVSHRLDAATRLLAWRIAAYDDHAWAANPVSDGPARRALDLSRRDCVEDLASLAAAMVRPF